MGVGLKITGALATATLATSLLVAAPAAAATVQLPTGCTDTDGQKTVQRFSDVSDLICAKPSNSMDLGAYTGLRSLQIGTDSYNTAPKLTKLPTLPAGLTNLRVHAPTITNVESLRRLTKLEDVLLQATALSSFTVLDKSKKTLGRLYLEGNYWGKNLGPLSGFGTLKTLTVRGDGADARATETRWVPSNFPKGLDGKYLLPRNDTWIDLKNKRHKMYTFDAKTGKVRNNAAGGHGQIIDVAPRSTKQPKLKVSVYLTRTLYVHQLAEWGHDPKNTLIISGAPGVGQTLTARHKSRNDFKQYADTFRWYRNGTAIKGATSRSYKLTKADLGKKITLKATDNKPTIGFGMSEYTPVSYTFTAAKKVLNGYKTHRPVLTGYSNVGSTLKFKMKTWSPKPTTLRYQWYRDGKPVKGSTKTTYKVTSKDIWKSVTVQVTGSRKGYVTLGATSKMGKLGMR